MAILRNAFRGLVTSLVLLAAGATSALSQTAQILPNAKTQFFNGNGQPLAGGSVFFFVPNTSTPKTTWQDPAESTPNAQPVVLDSAGTAFIFGSGSYTETLYDSLNNLIWSGLTSSPGFGTPITTGTGDIVTWCGTSGGSLCDLGVLMVPNGTQLYASPSGSDATSNNCTASGSPCTLRRACQARTVLATFLQSTSGNITINLANGTYSAVDNNNALCTIIGNSGGSAAIFTPLVGNMGSPASVVLAVPADDIGVFTKDLGETALSGITITGGNGSVGVSAAQYSVADMSGVVWGSWGTGGIHLNISQGGSMNIFNETLSANINAHINITGGANVFVGPSAINIPSPIAFGTAFVNSIGNVTMLFNSNAFTGAGISGTTGTRAILAGTGFLTTGGFSCNSFFPGNGACTIELGFVDDAFDLQTNGDMLNTAMPAPTRAGDLVYNNGTTWWQSLAGNNSGTRVFSENSSGVPAWLADSTTVNGQTCALGSTCAITATAGSMTVGTTTVIGGTSLGVLYDNAGVLGNTNSADNAVLVTSGSGVPSFSTTLPSGLTIPGYAPLASPTFTGTVTMPDAGTWSSSGIVGLTSLKATVVQVSNGNFAANGLQLSNTSGLPDGSLVENVDNTVSLKTGTSGILFLADRATGAPFLEATGTGSPGNGYLIITGTGNNAFSDVAITATKPSTLYNNGALTIAGGLGVAGAVNVQSNLGIGTQGTTQGTLTLANTAFGGWPTIIQSSNSATASATYTLPVAAPLSSGYVMTATTAGVMSWTNPASLPSTPCTTTANSIPYDNAGAFGCVSGVLSDGTNVQFTTDYAGTFPTINKGLSLGTDYAGDSEIDAINTNTSAGPYLFAWYFLTGTNTGHLVMSLDNAGNYSMGDLALVHNIPTSGTSGEDNIAIGNQAMTTNTTGYDNVAMGLEALFGNTSGASNLALGQSAMFTNSTGFNNIALGVAALFGNTTGHDNVAISNSAAAMFDNIDGFENVAIGDSALFANTHGSDNVAIGDTPLSEATTVSPNVAIGDNALGGAIVTGNNNIGIGDDALSGLTSGIDNNAIGSLTLVNLTTGSHNIALGDTLGGTLTTGSGNILIGASLDVATAATSNFLNIGGVISGNMSSGPINIAKSVTVTGSLQVGSATPATLSTGEFDLVKISASGSAPTAGNLKIEAVAGTNSGSCKIIAYAGTSSTPVTIVDNVGSGC